MTRSHDRSAAAAQLRSALPVYARVAPGKRPYQCSTRGCWASTGTQWLRDLDQLSMAQTSLRVPYDLNDVTTKSASDTTTKYPVKR